MASIQTRQQDNLRRTSLIAAPVVLLVTLCLLFNGFC